MQGNISRSMRKGASPCFTIIKSQVQKIAEKSGAITILYTYFSLRRGDLIVSAGSASPARGQDKTRHFTLSVPLSTN